MADWMIAGHRERLALAVMSSMVHQAWTEETAMIGATTTESRGRAQIQIRQQHLAENSMQVCSSKSFIHTSAPRSTDIQ
jgi:hypothetical protein